MSQKFLNLKEEKKSAIINAALKEFTKKGYELASTNEIVEEAGISKGSLFHYFKNKQDLFLFLCSYTFNVVQEEFYNRIDTDNPDLLDRYRQSSILKMNIVLKYPGVFDFLLMLLSEEAGEVKPKIQESLDRITVAGYDKLFSNIDGSKFKSDYPAEKIKDIIVWSAEGYGNQLLKKIKGKSVAEIDMEAIICDFDQYLDILRDAFYR
ncbi:MAG: HTH-type transcriptional regulator MtrR [Pelotomaculum sp. PtaB.Bin104]|nr:MAG: HTH-type transcriptional regulator MtrR [Pelotomaculum sp. PtaB.Bin104]